MKLIPAVVASALIVAPVAPAMAADLSSMQLALNDTQARQTFTMTTLPETFQVAGGMITSGGMVTSNSSARRAAAGDKNPWIAALLNFFFMGAGYVYNGEDVPLGLALTASSIGLTYVELGLQNAAFATTGTNTDKLNWGLMFGSVFLANTFLAMDAYQQAEELNGK